MSSAHRSLVSRPALFLVPIYAVALVFPLIAPNPFYVHILAVGMIFAVLAASWDLLYGYTGLISFGHAAFFGFGAYASALTTFYFGIDPWIGIFVGMIGAAGFGALVALPSMRLKGVYLALTTLAFAEVLRIIVTNWHEVTRGTLGFSSHPPLTGLGGDPAAHYYLMLVVSGFAVGGMYWLGNRTRTGLMLKAVRDDEIRAQSLGIDIIRVKMVAFVVSGAMAGLVGAIYAHYISVISPAEIGAHITMLSIAMATIGGLGTIVGPAFAGLALHTLIELLHIFGTVYKLVAVGILLVVFVIFMPQGLAGVARRIFSNSSK